MAEISGNKNTSIYVIDDEYRLVYFNQVLQDKYPQAKTGDFCYERLCGEKQPCQVCPLARKSGSETLYYNRLMKCWINIGTGDLAWPGKDRCHIILATSIHEDDALYEELLNPLTGLYKRGAFFQKGEEFLDEAADGRYCLVAIDIEHFKLFNDWYGQKEGDKLLVDIGRRLLQLQQEGKGVAGYIGGDDFAILMPDDAEEIRTIQASLTEYVKAYGENAGFLPTFGVYEIEEREHSLSAMYDRAVIAANSIKGNYAQRICYYDRRMKQRMEEDHLLLSEVQRGMENGEFVFYTQPKCDLSTGRIVGLEALVRWNHSVRGVISPGTFLPLLESNGLITNLDIFIWESVCKKVRSWIDQGRRPIPISVNVSCVDIFAIDVVETFRQLVRRYDLDPRLIEIEITESAYVERFDEVIRIVEALRSAGFTVLMDDFGSGYSSLNMLKDVSVDILKIDMKFLDLNENSLGRGVSILEAIAKMAHIMGLKLIAEGVETKEQVGFLLNVGCNYGQGYYFYRPIPPEDMEALIVNEENVDYRGITLQQMEPVRMRDLFNEDVLSDTMAGNILGAAAFYDVHDDRLELLRANEKYCAVIRISMVDLEEQRAEILQEIYPEDRAILRGLFLMARENQTKGAEGVVRRRTGDGVYLWIKIRLFYLREQDGHQIYYGSLSDVTGQKQKEDQLESFQRALASVVNVSNDDQSFMKLTEENRRAAATIAAQMSPGGMIGGYCEPGFPLYFANYEMVQLLGYDTYEELAEAIGQRVENTIHPDDRARVAADIGPEYYLGLEYVTSYRMPKKDGTWFWTLDKGRVIRAEDGRLAIVSACTDISEAVAAQQQLLERNALLMRKNEELFYINRVMPGGYHRCANTPDYDFIYISDRFLEVFGYTREEIREKFDNKFVNMIHPDDRGRVASGVKKLVEHDEAGNLEYRMLSSRGYIWVIDQSRYTEFEGTVFIQGVVLDVTESVTLRNRMRMLIKHMPDSMTLLHWNGKKASYEVIANGLLQKYGYTAEYIGQVLNGEDIWEFLHEGDAVRVRANLRDAIGREADYQDVVRFRGKDESIIWANFLARKVFKDQDRITYLCVYSDITNIKQKEQEVMMTGLKLESILRQAGINSWDWDFRKNTLRISGSAAMFPAFSRGWFKEKNGQMVLEDFLEVIMQGGYMPERYREDVKDYLDRVRENPPGSSIHCEFPIEIESGKHVWLTAACETLRDENGIPVKAVGYYRNISEERRQVQHLTQMAETDAMTGLFNRQAAIPRIEEYIQSIGDGSAAMVMFDLDNFKQANDVFGHSFGDTMIVENARRLKQFFRKDDIICRIGGDEFMILCKNIREKDLIRKLTKVINAMTIIHEKEGQSIRFSSSAGYVMIPEQGTEFDDLYGKTDVALFAAKLKGKGAFCKYSPEMKSVRYELAEKNTAENEPEV